MSETTTREETKREKPVKRGLHGWKAALAVFGCGTLAAFGVFGVIVGLLSMLVNAASSGISGSTQSQQTIPDQVGKPRDSLEPGALNICEDYFNFISDVQIDSFISSDHSDDAEASGYSEGDEREVSDECKFTIIPQFGSTSLWYLDFNFTAFVYDPGGEEYESAEELFLSEYSSAGGLFSEVEEGDGGDWAEEVRSFYGAGEDGTSQYFVIARSGSVVYSFMFSGDASGAEGGRVSEFDFSRQVERLGPRIDKMFFDAIPE
ncbi:hypothetical protein GTW20_16065 [Nocardiopsis alba]|uniref:DUF3558 domain-containing protein n=1 Tax=Nocardiopsis alba TaxID=53437 RepID=A0A7K2IVC8_9ACTN|nr:hypothetical protein [Nocardiopsis alba]MYR33735.1 hypothetical protein [Nocardiopsis alba]